MSQVTVGSAVYGEFDSHRLTCPFQACALTTF